MYGLLRLREPNVLESHTVGERKFPDFDDGSARKVLVLGLGDCPASRVQSVQQQPVSNGHCMTHCMDGHNALLPEHYVHSNVRYLDVGCYPPGQAVLGCTAAGWHCSCPFDVPSLIATSTP